MTRISKESFGFSADGREVFRYNLINEGGMQVSVLSYACAVQRILVPDKCGKMRDVALGYDNLSGYEKGSSFFGAFVGRFANRIRGAEFSLGGKTYALEKNEGQNHLHGSFARRCFDGAIENDSVVFGFVSPPSEEGYPGTLEGKVIYRLTDENALEIEYVAVSDEDTVINLTNHTYFNLNGNDGSDILGHVLRLNADSFTEIDSEKLATGKILSVDGTPLDFRSGKKIGAEIFGNFEQLKYVSGFDHNLIINSADVSLREFARAKSEESGIVLTAFTTEPGVQLYTGNFVQDDAAPCGKNGIRYPRFGGFCLETQHYPCSPNIPEFPSTVLKKGEVYRGKTVCSFSAET